MALIFSIDFLHALKTGDRQTVGYRFSLRVVV